MKVNQRGEVVTVGIVAAAIIVGLLGFTVGASGIRKWVPGFGGGDNKTKEVRITKTESRPIIVKGADGKEYFLQATKTETSNVESVEPQRLSIWQRLWALPRLWLLLMILGIFFPPVAAFMGFINRRLWVRAKQIVGGVEESLKTLEAKQPEAKTVVLETLSKKMDSDAKKMVSTIKRQL